MTPLHRISRHQSYIPHHQNHNFYIQTLTHQLLAQEALQPIQNDSAFVLAHESTSTHVQL